jgi:hypothetical protein
MTSFIVNPKLSVDKDTVLGDVQRWLREDATRASRYEDDVFEAKWDALQPEDRSILTALVAEGGREIKE